MYRQHLSQGKKDLKRLRDALDSKRSDANALTAGWLDEREDEDKQVGVKRQPSLQQRLFQGVVTSRVLFVLRLPLSARCC
mmetsp:Transcript_52079/g.77774  ORF Transcript_52079/g.77774 Transcript_52079/m.77774 type:complete len:80 (-) Transcript_52079:40-279(-)